MSRWLECSLWSLSSDRRREGELGCRERLGGLLRYFYRLPGRGMNATIPVFGQYGVGSPGLLPNGSNSAHTLSALIRRYA